LISTKFNEAKTKAKGYIAELIAYTQPGEIEQQKKLTGMNQFWKKTSGKGTFRASTY
jgi:hypothetical protein